MGPFLNDLLLALAKLAPQVHWRRVYDSKDPSNSGRGRHDMCTPFSTPISE